MAPVTLGVGFESFFLRLAAGGAIAMRDPEASAATWARVRTPLEYVDDTAALALRVEGVMDISAGGGGEGVSSITMISLTRPVVLSTCVSDL